MTPGDDIAANGPPVLAASSGDPFPSQVLARAGALAREFAGPVLVVSVARIWGSAFGLPNPGLYPTRQEMDQQRDLVAAAASTLAEDGLTVRTAVLQARNPGKAIALYAERSDCRTVVVATGNDSRWRRMLSGGVASEIRRRTRISVEAVSLSKG